MDSRWCPLVGPHGCARAKRPASAPPLDLSQPGGELFCHRLSMFLATRIAQPCMVSRTAAMAARSLSTKSAARSAPLATRSPVMQQVRLMRHTRFQRPQPRSPAYAETGSEYQSSYGPSSFASQGGWTRALTSVGIVAGTAIGLNLFFNRETRGALSVYAVSYTHLTLPTKA